MITASLSEAKNRLVSLVKAVEEGGETVVLCRNGLEVAEIRPLPRGKRLLRNLSPSPCLAVDFAHGYDPTEALTEDEWPVAGR
jgi:prevent-host-death family protein